MSPSPNIKHQKISGEIAFRLREHIKKNNGKCSVFEAPTDVKLSENTLVIPDIFVACNPDNFEEQFYNGAPDLIIEIVSPSNSNHDYKDKLYIYKSFGVREYWIVDPAYERVVVYLFGDTNFTEFYSFDDKIPVKIFDSELLICISDFM